MFAFDTQGVLKGLNTGWEALRYTFTFTLWKPDPECASDQHTWNAAIGPAWLASGASWAAGVVAAPGIAARLAPNAARFLDPAATAAASTLVVENAENPAAEEEEINEFGTDCLNAIEGELQNSEATEVNEGENVEQTREQWEEQANERYPKKAGLKEWHHIWPKYLKMGKGELIQLNAPYHQLLTNAIREEFPYGDDYSDMPNEEIWSKLNKIYCKYGLNFGQ